MIHKEVILSTSGLGKSYYINRKGDNAGSFRDVLSKLYTLSFLKKNQKKNRNIYWALKNVNIDVYRGDRLILLGNNGAGKSTFLKLVSNIMLPTEGDINIKGSFQSLLQTGSGFHDELTGIENIYLNAALLGISRSTIKDRIDEIIDFSELGDFIYNPIKTYSSGMIARLGFSILIVNIKETDLIILDEIFATGDHFFRKKCFDSMEKIFSNKKKTLIYVGHGEPISGFFNRGIILRNGCVVKDSSFKASFKAYKKNEL